MVFCVYYSYMDPFSPLLNHVGSIFQRSGTTFNKIAVRLTYEEEQNLEFGIQNAIFFVCQYLPDASR